MAGERLGHGTEDCCRGYKLGQIGHIEPFIYLTRRRVSTDAFQHFFKNKFHIKIFKHLIKPFLTGCDSLVKKVSLCFPFPSDISYVISD